MPQLPTVHRPRWAEKMRHDRLIRKAERNQAARMYRTSHPTWRKIRKAVLMAEPLCRECAKHDRITPATDVDHIDGDSWNNAASNLQPLCSPCHGRKTAREQQAK